MQHSTKRATASSKSGLKCASGNSTSTTASSGPPAKGPKKSTQILIKNTFIQFEAPSIDLSSFSSNRPRGESCDAVLLCGTVPGGNRTSPLLSGIPEALCRSDEEEEDVVKRSLYHVLLEEELRLGMDDFSSLDSRPDNRETDDGEFAGGFPDTRNAFPDSRGDLDYRGETDYRGSHLEDKSPTFLSPSPAALLTPEQRPKNANTHTQDPPLQTPSHHLGDTVTTISSIKATLDDSNDAQLDSALDITPDELIDTLSKCEELKRMPLEELPQTSHEKTTIMLRNIPNKYTQSMLLEAVNAEFAGLFDFFYLPIDFKNRCNVGYAFINFIHPYYAEMFAKKFSGLKLNAFKSKKICEVSWGRVQGLRDNIEHYRNSAIMSIPNAQYKPLVFKDGVALRFPGPSTSLPSVKPRPNQQRNSVPQ